MKKRTTMIMISLILSTVLIAGVTFAYFTATSEEKVNTFTVGDNISIALAEPLFDGLDYDGEDVSEEDVALGEDLALNILPGREIPKDPMVKNTSNDNVWVAIKLDYGKDISSFAELDAFASIIFDSNWEEKDGSNTVFYFKTEVGAGDETSSLFDNVTIDNVSYEDLKEFDIEIMAYAVQAEGVDFTDAKSELDDLMAP
jgi:predicted ribosomally synthesized peptide with SipW-like signal peptide